MSPNPPAIRPKVLVFPCGSEIGLEIQRALRFSRHVELLGASSVASNHGRFVFADYAEGLPFVDDPRFLDSLNKFIDNRGVDLVFPAHDSVVLLLAQRREQLHCRLIGSPAETCEICRSKRATSRAFESLLRVPRLFEPSEQSLFPVFLKPDIGQGSKGTHLARSREELEFHLKRDPSLLILEYLPGKEYTIECFTDRHGKLLFAKGRQRIRVSGGISVDTRPVEDERFSIFAGIIQSKLAFRGPWFYQLKETADGDLALMEIAPRIAGSTGLYRALGINLPLLSVFDALNVDVNVLCNHYSIQMDRALVSRFITDLDYEHVYVDFDDTLILDDRVNVTAAAFLYQCRNRNVGLHLLTRGTGDIYEKLRRFALTEVFDSVEQIPPTAPKSQYMTLPKAIFIDDSFAERKEVSDSLGIPTFAPDMLECLLSERD
jgi:hypothetical protein